MPERVETGRHRTTLLWVLVAVLVALADQATKHLLAAMIAPGEIRGVASFFNLVHVFNRGGAFSLFADAPGWQRELFTGIAIAASLVMVALLFRNAAERLFCTGVALILGGALGNLWDRVTLGQVLDFLDFHMLGYHWPAFNFADSAITVGAALLILDGFRAKKEPAA